MKPAHLLLVALLASAATTPTARAADPAASSDVQRGKELFENGATLYDEGNYEAAIAAFEEALRLTGEKSLYYNIANCYERLARWQEAYDALNMYRAYAPADERETLERRIRSVDDRLREQRAREAAVVAPPPTAAPTTPPPTAPAPSGPAKVRGPINWALGGTGAGLAVLGGVGAGVTFAASRKNLEENDPDAYATNRALNTASLAVTGIGAAVAIIGFAVPFHKSGLSVGLQGQPGGTAITFNGQW
jgi:tetratricopeptide (TPR) repeat protein